MHKGITLISKKARSDDFKTQQGLRARNFQFRESSLLQSLKGLKDNANLNNYLH